MYKLLFSISFYHTFYEDGFCEDLMFQLNEETKQVFQSFGFKMIIEKNGLKVYTDSSQSIQDLLNSISQNGDISSFQFELNTTNSDFYVFTESPINEIIQYDLNSQNIIDNSIDDTIQLVLNIKKLNVPNLLGMLTVNFEDILKHDSEEKELDFSANFLARKTQWEYYIINSSNQVFDGFSIVNDSGIIFSVPIKTTLQNGQEALLFKSEQLITLSEVPKYKFDLISNISQHNQKIVFKGLPSANTSGFSIFEDQIVASPMYIYL